MNAAEAEAAEAAYCAARARRYIPVRTRHVADVELAEWLRLERAAAREEVETRVAVVRALLLHLQRNLEAVVAKLATVRPPPEG